MGYLPQKAPSAELKYPTKDITFVVPVSPGGGFDTLARILAPYLSKYLPNKPNVIIANVPGGDWIRGINKIVRATPNGYTIGMFNLPGNLMGQIVGTADYNLEAVSWIGCISVVPYVAALSPKSKYKTFQDVKAAPEVLVGSTGLATTSAVGVIIALHTIGIKPRFVLYKGSSEIYVAAMRGDLDYVQQAYGSIKTYINPKKLLLNPLCIFTDKRLPQSPEIPTIAELGYPELANFISTYYAVGTTPGTPVAILEVLRNAFDKAMADPEFQNTIERGGFFKNPIKGKDMPAIVKTSMEKFARYKDLIMQYQYHK